MTSGQSAPVRAQDARGRLRTRRGLLLTALPIVFGLAVVAALLAVQHRNASAADRRAEARTLAVTSASNATRYLEDQFALLETVATAPSVREHRLARMTPFLRRVTAQGRFSNNLGFVDRAGVMRASARVPPGLRLGDRPYVRAGLAGRRAVSDGLIGRASGRPILAFGVPVVGRDGGVPGVLVGSVRLDEVSTSLQRLVYAPGAGEVVVDGRDHVLVGPDPVRALRPPPAVLPLARMRRERTGVLPTLRLRGEKRLVAFAAVPGTRWLAIVDEPYGDTLGPLNTALTIELAALLVLAVLAVLATLAVAGRLAYLDTQQEAAYEQQRRIAEQLQRSLLPGLPASIGVEVQARYAPAQAELSVGGDWYDVVDTADGRVAASVGDVTGHGLSAAAVMGQLRSAGRTLALGGTAPGDALRQLDRFTSLLDGRPLATVVHAVLDTGDGTLRYACAGHPPPLLLRTDGTASFLAGGRSPLLGVAPGERRAEGTTRLGAGDTLVLYTDGLIERPGHSLDAGMAAMVERAVAIGGDPVRLADGLLAGVPSPRRDDVAVLCVRLVADRATAASASAAGDQPSVAS